MKPQEAAAYSEILVQRWASSPDGPDQVFKILEQWTEDELRYFAMMNIGAKAQAV